MMCDVWVEVCQVTVNLLSNEYLMMMTMKMSKVYS